MSLTSSNPTYEAACDGFIAVAPLDPAVQQSIAGLQAKLAERFSAEAFWIPTGDQLHITVAHVLSPEVTYDEPAPEIFGRVGQQAMRALDIAVQDRPTDTVVFDTVEAFADAIIVRGHDSGELDAVRQTFVDNFDLPAGTRRPPTIIHSTIARYRKPLNLEEVQEFVSSLAIDSSTDISEIHLVHERQIFMQASDILQTYNLRSPVAASKETI
jgi:2'-5' RNA ligase